MKIFHRRQGSTVGLESDYGLDKQAIVGQLLEGARDL